MRYKLRAIPYPIPYTVAVCGNGRGKANGNNNSNGIGNSIGIGIDRLLSSLPPLAAPDGPGVCAESRVLGSAEGPPKPQGRERETCIYSKLMTDFIVYNMYMYESCLRRIFLHPRSRCHRAANHNLNLETRASSHIMSRGLDEMHQTQMCASLEDPTSCYDVFF